MDLNEAISIIFIFIPVVRLRIKLGGFENIYIMFICWSVLHLRIEICGFKAIHTIFLSLRCLKIIKVNKAIRFMLVCDLE